MVRRCIQRTLHYLARAQYRWSLMMMMMIMMLIVIFRPYCLHTVHRCGQLLQMSLIVWSVGHTGSCVKTAEPMKMPFFGLTHMGQRNHVLDRVQITVWEWALLRG